MKQVLAYIRPHRLDDVRRALEAIPGFHGMTVLDGRGFGREKMDHAPTRLAEKLQDFVPVVRIETVVADGMVEAVLDAIVSTVRTGSSSDGKIFVLPVTDALRVRTLERGEEAI